MTVREMFYATTLAAVGVVTFFGIVAISADRFRPFHPVVAAGAAIGVVTIVGGFALLKWLKTRRLTGGRRVRRGRYLVVYAQGYPSNVHRGTAHYSTFRHAFSFDDPTTAYNVWAEVDRLTRVGRGQQAVRELGVWLRPSTLEPNEPGDPDAVWLLVVDTGAGFGYHYSRTPPPTATYVGCGTRDLVEPLVLQPASAVPAGAVRALGPRVFDAVELGHSM